MGKEDGAVLPLRRAQGEEDHGRQRRRPPHVEIAQQGVEQRRRPRPGQHRQQQHIRQARVARVVAGGEGRGAGEQGGRGDLFLWERVLCQQPTQPIERNPRHRRPRRPIAKQPPIGRDGHVVALGEVVELVEREGPVGDHRPQQGVVAAVVAAGDAGQGHEVDQRQPGEQRRGNEPVGPVKGGGLGGRWRVGRRAHARAILAARGRAGDWRQLRTATILSCLASRMTFVTTFPGRRMLYCIRG